MGFSIRRVDLQSSPGLISLVGPWRAFRSDTAVSMHVHVVLAMRVWLHALSRIYFGAVLALIAPTGSVATVTKSV